MRKSCILEEIKLISLIIRNHMKPIISFLQFLLLTVAFSSSAAVTIDLQTGRLSGSTPATPTVTLTELPDGYKVTYTITQAELSSSSASENGDTWSILGFSNVENEGLPVLPYKGDSFILPIGSSPSVTVLESEFVEFDGKIRLGDAPLFDGMSQPATVSSTVGSFKSDGFFPAAIVKCEPLQVYRDRPIATVAITPMQYDSENAKIRVYTRISYKLSYEASTRTAVQAKTLHTVSEDDPFLTSYVINPPADSNIKRAGGSIVIPDIMNSMLPEGYLIITTPKFQSAVTEFVKWKKMLGFNVTVKYDNNWTVEKVSNAVKQQWDKNTFKYSFNIPTGCRASVYNVTQDSVIVFDMHKGSVTFPKNDDISICFTGDNIRCLQWSNVQTVRPQASRIMESNIMVREDRIWEHYGFDGSIWTEWFEGTTEINGKTYHNFHLRDVKPDNSEVELLIAYMREDAGKVYMIASELTPLQQKIFGSAFYINYEDELLVYDFNLNKDDVMLMTQDPIVQSSKIWPLTTGEYQNVHYITDKFVLEYQGKTFDTYEVTVIYPYNGHKWQYEVIKGVGGFQSAMCFPVLSSRYDCIEGKLHRVKLYDLDRNLLFDSYGAQMLSATDVEADGGVNFDGKVIRIDEAGADCRVDIYDTCGSLVRSNAGEACAETSLDGLARGVYIVRVSGTTNGCTAMKINI